MVRESRQIVLKKRPVGPLKISWTDAERDLDLVTAKTAELKEGQLLVKVLYLSNDPVQRVWMNEPSGREYKPPIAVGDIVPSLGLGRVLETKSAKFAKDDLVGGTLAWAEYAVVDDCEIWNKIDPKGGLPATVYISHLGLTGLTAYFGLTEAGQFKKGQSVIVNAASGATGSMVVQIAKKLYSARRVIAITGSDAKCAWVKSLGADFAVNYKDPQYVDKLKEFIKDDFVDVVYDNVGGKILGSVMGFVRNQGRVVACGAISGFNDVSAFPVHEWFHIISCRICIQGMVVSDYLDKFPAAVATLAAAIKKGDINVDDSIAVIDMSKEENPLSKVPETWTRLFADNKPNGKLITKIAQE